MRMRNAFDNFFREPPTTRNRRRLGFRDSRLARTWPIGSSGTTEDSAKKKKAFATASLLPNLDLADFGNQPFASLQLMGFCSPCANYDTCGSLWLVSIIGFSVMVSSHNQPNERNSPQRQMRRSGDVYARASRSEGFGGHPLGNEKGNPFELPSRSRSAIRVDVRMRVHGFLAIRRSRIELRMLSVPSRSAKSVSFIEFPR